MNSKKNIRIAYVISNIDRWISFEWIEEYFQDSKFDIDFYLLSNKKGFFYKYLKKKKQNVQLIYFKTKIHYPIIIYRLTKIFREYQYHVVHCHFLDATLCGLTAARLVKVPKRIFTRHHSTSHHEYAKKGVWYDIYCNALATDIVAVSNIVKATLIEKEGCPSSKITLINHGFNLSEIIHVPLSRIDIIKSRYDLNSKYIIGVVSRFIELKGVQYIIPAFKKYLDMDPLSVLVLANAQGNYSLKITEFLEEIPEKNYRIIPFEQDIYALFHCFDTFIHVPIKPDIEAFGQIYVESLAAGVPSIFTVSGIAHNFIKHEENAIVVPYKDSEAIYNGILRIRNEKEFSKSLAINGKKSVNKLFQFKSMMGKLTKLYLE